MTDLSSHTATAEVEDFDTKDLVHVTLTDNNAASSDKKCVENLQSSDVGEIVMSKSNCNDTDLTEAVLNANTSVDNTSVDNVHSGSAVIMDDSAVVNTNSLPSRSRSRMRNTGTDFIASPRSVTRSKRKMKCPKKLPSPKVGASSGTDVDIDDGLAMEGDAETADTADGSSDIPGKKQSAIGHGTRISSRKKAPKKRTKEEMNCEKEKEPDEKRKRKKVKKSKRDADFEEEDMSSVSHEDVDSDGR
jgi:hypothetical protein